MPEENNQEYVLTEGEDIYGALRKIVLMETPVSVKIDGSDETFHSAITDTVFKTRSFFMDKVIPEHGNDLIRQGKRFSIECDTQGVRIEFRMSGRLKYKPENEQYRAEFPLEVLYLQRRTAYRVLIPPAHQILIKIKMDDEQGDLIGRLLDLSSSGFKVQFEGDAKARLEKQKQFPVARVRFNRENTIDCSLEARHVVINDQGDTQCGFAFTLLSPAAQRYLDRLITEFQWEERQIKRQQEQDFPPL